jgi:hypothetical protein
MQSPRTGNSLFITASPAMLKKIVQMLVTDVNTMMERSTP